MLEILSYQITHILGHYVFQILIVYQFTINDTYGDGLSAGTSGSYNIYYNGNMVASLANTNFGNSETIFNIGDCLLPPSLCPNNEG